MTGGIKRRHVLTALGLVGVAAASWKFGLDKILTLGPEIPFTDFAGVDGYRVLKGNSLTLGGIAFFGLDTEKPQNLNDAERLIASDLCGPLFPNHTAGTVPLAYFYDYQCPICRTITPRLRKLKNVSLNWHELAGLGPASETAAKASVAAALQGKFDVFHDRLMRAAFQPNEGYIRRLSDSIGIDTKQLIIDMQSQEVEKILWRSRALANKFGLLGTPGMVVGRTIIIGNVSDAVLRSVVKEEIKSGQAC